MQRRVQALIPKLNGLAGAWEDDSALVALRVFELVLIATGSS